MNEDLKIAIAEALEVAPEELTSDKELSDIDSWDSVMALTVMVILGDGLGVPVTPIEMKDIKTFGDLEKLVAAKQKGDKRCENSKQVYQHDTARKEGMIVAIHQPNFFPWLGFFDKMRLADVFVLVDTVPFTKGGHQNRVRMKGQSGPQWLTVPVMTKGRLGQPTLAVATDPTVSWRSRHLKTFRNLYCKAEFYKETIERLESIYEGKDAGLVNFCISGITSICDLLGIRTRLVRASELGVQGVESGLLSGIVKKLGGKTYLSGPSGRSYLDMNCFADLEIAVEFHSFIPFEYTQRYKPFAPGLSAVDYLFNMGPTPWWGIEHHVPSVVATEGVQGDGAAEEVWLSAYRARSDAEIIP